MCTSFLFPVSFFSSLQEPKGDFTFHYFVWHIHTSLFSLCLFYISISKQERKEKKVSQQCHNVYIIIFKG